MLAPLSLAASPYTSPRVFTGPGQRLHNLFQVIFPNTSPDVIIMNSGTVFATPEQKVGHLVVVNLGLAQMKHCYK